VTPKKVVFDQPVVRVQVEKVRFPKICPICGAPGTQYSRISAVVGRKEYLSRSWDPAYSPGLHRAPSGPPPPSKTFLVSVCSAHSRSDEGDTNYKLLCMIGDGLLAAAGFFALMILGGNLWNNRPLDSIALGVVLSLLIALLTTVYAFRQGSLKNAIKIVGFDSGYDYVWLDFKLPQYRELFVKENEMYAELVDWIVRT
jgi:hypothetical protein